MAEAIAGSLNIPDTRHYLWTLQGRLPQFVVYDHPSDWPDFYVARLWLALPEPTPLPLVLMDRDLDRLQTTMDALGMVKLMPSEGDDPVILETWI
jgi:hypothetical protein